MRADVMAGRGAIVGELRDFVCHRIVLIDLPRGLGYIRVLFAGVQGKTQREHELLAVGRNVQIPDIALALSDRLSEVDLRRSGTCLVADIQIPARRGGNQIPSIDVRLGVHRGGGPLHIG